MRFLLFYLRLRALKLTLLKFLLLFLSSIIGEERVFVLWPRCRRVLVTTERGREQVVGLTPPREVFIAHWRGLHCSRSFHLMYTTEAEFTRSVSAKPPADSVLWQLSVHVPGGPGSPAELSSPTYSVTQFTSSVAGHRAHHLVRPVISEAEVLFGDPCLPVLPL